MNNFPVAYLNSNDGTGLLAFGDGPTFRLSGNSSVAALQEFLDQQKGKHVFGYVSYDLKNQLFGLQSENTDHLHFPDAYFWVPEHVVKMYKEHFEFLQGGKDEASFEFLNAFMEEETDQFYHHHNYRFEPRITKEQYLQTIEELKKHLQNGDIYEVNFCQEFFAENAEMDYPLDTYFKLNNLTQAPFSSFLDIDEFAVFCGSPERFLKKTGSKLKSQPIKGTAPRGGTPVEDVRIREKLCADPKERAENVMIVDLVRNDLSRIATIDSVKVDELCGIHTFETVHQLVSTVSCEVKPETNFTDILKATFPMGSMTGAPKRRSMELIEEYESFKRGLYSGSIGYIAPNGDFDFNVVIRTLLYNKDEHYLSCSVGGAITIQSDPEKEYEECLIKVSRILEGINA